MTHLTIFLRTARSLRGARSFGAATALLAVLGAAPASLAARADVPQAMPWRVSGRPGFTVDEAAFPDSAGTTLEIYVRIPPMTLQSMARDSLGRGRLALSLRLRNPAGGRLPEDRKELVFSSADTAGGFGKVVVMRYATHPGAHRLHVRLEDLNSRKTGLAYLGRSAHEALEIDGGFLVPKPQSERDLSDLEFVWAEPDTGIDLFRRAGHTLLPNPERLYGLYASDLSAFFLARSRAGDERAWRWVARVLDASGKPLVAQESTGVVGRWCAGLCRLDVSTLPAGGYDLEVKAWQEGDAGALLRRSHFSVAWQAESWASDPLEIADEVHLLFEADEEQRFAGLQPGEQEREVEDFWRRRDPTPETAANEAREIFRRRVEEANRLYSRPGLMRGMFSDMGRVLIRYGEPSDISRQVIPTGDETLLQELQQIEIDEDRPTGEVHQKGPGGDQRPFEVWTYEPPVPPPLDTDPQVRGHDRHQRLLFLFVDQQGLGIYTLRYSTE